MVEIKLIDLINIRLNYDSAGYSIVVWNDRIFFYFYAFSFTLFEILRNA